ncbi:MAG: MTH938/NDUFAF3 family protein [Candidatus Methanofastidiosia archaeon]
MIEHYSFGRIGIDGKEYTSDVLIVGGKVHNWWRKQGHIVAPEDLDVVVDESPETLVVGTGAYGVMKVPDRTRKYLENKGIFLITEKTGDAVTVFNKLTGKKAAAFHLTC